MGPQELFRRGRGRPPYPGTFTPAEQRVLDGLRRGLTYQQIAGELGLAYDTVKYHVSNMLAKAGVERREDLVAFSRRPGLRWSMLPIAVGWAATGGVVLLVAAAAVAVLLARGDDPGLVMPTAGPDVTATTTGEVLVTTGNVLEQVSSAIAKAGAYRLEATQENLVLPRWGGSDGGTVLVDVTRRAAAAELYRTGDGPYSIVLQDGETYFKRETCPTWAHISAGSEVLAPFIFDATRLRQARALELGPAEGTRLLVRLELPGIGQATMQVDLATFLPVRITAETASGTGAKPIAWTFSEWGQPVSISRVSATRDSGPGGNPC